MRELFAPVPRNICQDVSSIYGKSSGSTRCVKSPKINLILDPVCTQNKSGFIGKAETLPPPIITVSNQSNDTKQPPILPTIPESKDMADTDEINHVFQDQMRTENSDKFLSSEPKCASTLVRRTSYNNELEQTKLLLNTQLIKIQDVASEAKKHKILYEFAMEAEKA